MSSTDLKVARELRKTIEIVMRARKFQFSQLKDIGHKDLVSLAVATEGFGLLGERAPLTRENVSALSRMLTLYNLWKKDLLEAGYTEEEAEKILTPAKLLLKEAETITYVRSHRSETLVAPLSDILARQSLKLEKSRFLQEIGEDGEDEEP